MTCHAFRVEEFPRNPTFFIAMIKDDHIVPLHAIATAIEDIDEPLKEKFLFATAPGAAEVHRNLEYLWGLEIYTIDPKHERSIIRIRKSMQKPLSSDWGDWTLAPTEQTLSAMLSLQDYNELCPVSERKSFLTEFSAPEYEYIFVPLCSDVEFFILQSGSAPRRFSAPYLDFPRVTSSVNPFFVIFSAGFRIRPNNPLFSDAWHQSLGDMSVQWRPFSLPHDFLSSCYSCYPEDFRSETAYESEPDPHSGRDDPKSGSDETMVKPVEESPSPVPDKEELVYQWVQHDVDPRLHQKLGKVSTTPWPPAPCVEKSRALKDALRFYPCWHRETERGRQCSLRFYKQQPAAHLFSVKTYS
ncbi:hypothetical protein C8J56DRAFT_1157394 [Mycena floridula]|nr:hypothetical protein C8J56DRAFT_1157394 [Mycena floridula]